MMKYVDLVKLEKFVYKWRLTHGYYISLDEMQKVITALTVERE